MRLRKQKEQTQIFDFIRKKWLVLTPEEWVRQHVLNFLVQVKKYPVSSIAIERELQLNDLKKRFDIVVYTASLKPYLIVECKAPYIALDPLVVEQVLRYNLRIGAQLVMISNGISDLVFDQQNKVCELPEKDQINL